MQECEEMRATVSPGSLTAASGKHLVASDPESLWSPKWSPWKDFKYSGLKMLERIPTDRLISDVKFRDKLTEEKLRQSPFGLGPQALIPHPPFIINHTRPVWP